MIIEPWIENLRTCDVEIIRAGTTIYHGARRVHGEPLVQPYMFLTPMEQYAREYVAKDREINLRRALLTFVTKRDIVLLDISSLKMLVMTAAALDRYGNALGSGDVPVRENMIDTVRHVFGARVDGTIARRDKIEFHFDSRLTEIATLVCNVAVDLVAPDGVTAMQTLTAV